MLAPVEMGLLELLINSIEHGNLGITYREKTDLLETGDWMREIEGRMALPAYAVKYIRVAVNQCDRGVRIATQDQGDSFDPSPFMAGRADPGVAAMAAALSWRRASASHRWSIRTAAAASSSP